MFGKVKQFFGFVGIDVKLEINPSIPKISGQLEGRVIVTAKVKQRIASVKVSFYEEYATGSGDRERTETRNMSEWRMAQAFDIQEGETREFPFTLQYNLPLSMRPSTYKNGVMDALSKAAEVVASMGYHPSFYVSTVADVKGAALDPKQIQRVYFVD